MRHAVRTRIGIRMGEITDRPHYWLGAEQRNHSAAAKTLDFESGQSGPCLIGRQAMASIIMSLAEMVERRGPPHLQCIQSVRPDPRGGRMVLG